MIAKPEHIRQSQTMQLYEQDYDKKRKQEAAAQRYGSFLLFYTLIKAGELIHVIFL